MTAVGAGFSSDEVTYGPSCAGVLARHSTFGNVHQQTGRWGQGRPVTSGGGRIDARRFITVPFSGPSGGNLTDITGRSTSITGPD